jgi:hypothetical protein
MTLEPQLENATRCLIACHDPGGPLLASAPCWSDGDALWIAAPAADRLIMRLRQAPACGVGIDLELVASGTARVFGPHDLLGLIIHGPMISAAMTALAIHHPREVARAWLQGGSRQLAAVRVEIDHVSVVAPLAPPPGIAPGLPEVVPADIRRRLSGMRHVLLAIEEPRGPVLVPAVWSAGFRLDTDYPLPTGPGVPAAVAIMADGVGVTLMGDLDERGALHPSGASWWGGGRTGAAALPAPPRGAVQLPD